MIETENAIRPVHNNSIHYETSSILSDAIDSGSLALSSKKALQSLRLPFQLRYPKPQPVTLLPHSFQFIFKAFHPVNTPLAAPPRCKGVESALLHATHDLIALGGCRTRLRR